MYKTEAAIVTKPFADRPCACVKNHSPQPLRTEEHHPWPQHDQIKKYGKVVDDSTVPLCDTAHANVHTAINKWLRNQACDLPNRYQKKLAFYGFKKILEPGPPAPTPEAAA